MRNVVCLKWGDLYGPEYVNILYASVQRNLKSRFRFICFTENTGGLSQGIETQPLPDFPEPEWKYAKYCSAWRKLALFRSGLAGLRGRTLFLDLDLVIQGNLEPFFYREAPFSMIENWYQKGKGQASVMCFDDGVAERILNDYLADPESVHRQYRTEQEYISGRMASADLFFPPQWCMSFKRHVMPNTAGRFLGNVYREHPNAKILVFHGRPNPPDAILGKWGKPMSPLKRWFKGLKPNPWIADYWRE